ncbi:MAG: hypothetical protein ABSA94_21220, partial [Acidobacteriaceae bacterium]
MAAIAMTNSNRRLFPPNLLSPPPFPIAAGLFLLALVPFQLAAQTTPGQSTPAWNSVSPGFSPQVLLEHDGAMWAAGSDGSIAVSTDGGERWTRKHHDEHGGLLLSFAFVGARFGYAAGTGPHLLMTADGGETWNEAIDLPEATFQAAFGDTKHGIIRIHTALLSTIDGGKTWKPVVPENDPGWMQKYPYTVDLAALDGNHLIARVSEGEAGDGEFLWTADGGATWKANYLSSAAGAAGVFTAQGQYWSIGGEVVSGLHVPMAVRSSEGAKWDHLPVLREVCHWRDCRGCTPQGCFAGGTSFVPFSRILEPPAANAQPAASTQPISALEPLARFPQHTLSGQWARSGNNLCLLTHGAIECGPLSPAESLDTKADQAEWDRQPFPPLLQTRPSLASSSIESALPSGVQCIRCNLTKIFFSKVDNSGPVAMHMEFEVGPAGNAQKVKISGDVPEDVAAKLRTIAAGWLFSPYEKNGKPKSTFVALSGQIFIMNPDKPPQ